MFQNISDEIKQEEIEDVQKDSNKTKLLFKNMFKLQNIVIYFIIFCISTVKMELDIAPFGIAMFGVACGGGIPAGIAVAVRWCWNTARSWLWTFCRILNYCWYFYCSYSNI